MKDEGGVGAEKEPRRKMETGQHGEERQQGIGMDRADEQGTAMNTSRQYILPRARADPLACLYASSAYLNLEL